MNRMRPYLKPGWLDALWPKLLGYPAMPLLAQPSAGFHLSTDPGTCKRSNVPVDFLVPFSLGGPGRRSARPGPHGTAFAHIAKGLEAAVTDSSTFQLSALETGDTRVFNIAVAGPAALLVAKLHKIAEREGTPNRWAAKDGLDVLRLLRGSNLSLIAERLTRLEIHPVAGDVTKLARSFLQTLFVRSNGAGTKMAVHASLGLEDAAIIVASCEALANKLLNRWLH